MKGFLKKLGKVVAFPVTGPVKLVKKGTEKVKNMYITNIVRHVLTAVAGAGFAVTDEMVAQTISAVTFLVGLGWSIMKSRKDAQMNTMNFVTAPAKRSK